MSNLYIVKCKELYKIVEGKPQKNRKGFSKMARYENSISTLQARTILDMIKTIKPGMTADGIEERANYIVHSLETEFPEHFPVDNDKHFSYMAFTLSALAKHAVKIGLINIIEYLKLYAMVKERNEKLISDYGAFGDLLEILVRCAMLRKLSLVRWSALSVKDVMHSDILSKKFGKIEVGHNGKTLTFGTLFDYMAGDYDAVIYGVFSDEDKKEVYNLCKNGEYEKTLDYITSYCSLWENKYNFQKDIDNLSRGKGITVKGGQIQVVYNPSKYNAFVGALENGMFTSLYEILKRG